MTKSNSPAVGKLQIWSLITFHPPSLPYIYVDALERCTTILALFYLNGETIKTEKQVVEKH